MRYYEDKYIGFSSSIDNIWYSDLKIKKINYVNIYGLGY